MKKQKRLTLYGRKANRDEYEFPEDLYYGANKEFTVFEDTARAGDPYYFWYGTVYTISRSGGHIYQISYSPDYDLFDFREARSTNIREAFIWLQDIEDTHGDILPPRNKTKIKRLMRENCLLSAEDFED